jgi:hypothetical protein
MARRPRAGRGSPDPARGRTEGLPIDDKTTKDQQTAAPSDQKGDLRSSEAAGSGDPRRARRASVPKLRNPPSADSTACGSTASTFPTCIWETSASGNDVA